MEGTGRRIAAILALRFEDLRLDQGEYGSILWPADTDKTGKEWLVPLAKDARKAIDRSAPEVLVTLASQRRGVLATSAEGKRRSHQNRVQRGDSAH